MTFYEFREDKRETDSFSSAEKQTLKEAARKLKVREIPACGTAGTIKVHFASLFKSPGDILRIAW